MPSRVIDIPEHAQGLIARVASKKIWTRDMIAQFSARMIYELQVQKMQLERELFSWIEEIVPEVKDFSARKIDITSFSVIEIDEEEMEFEGARRVEIPERYREEAFEIFEQVDALVASQGGVGIAAMSMELEVDRIIARINEIVKTHIPECASGEWHVDTQRMVVIESIKKQAEASSDIEEPGSD